MTNKIALIVSDSIPTKEDFSSLYTIYKVTKNMTFDSLIEKAKNDGCKNIIAFATEEYELCGIKAKKTLQTFVTKCSGVSADFYIHEAKMFIKARLDFKDIIQAIGLSIRNSAFAMTNEYQAYLK